LVKVQLEAERVPARGVRADVPGLRADHRRRRSHGAVAPPERDLRSRASELNSRALSHLQRRGVHLQRTRRFAAAQRPLAFREVRGQHADALELLLDLFLPRASGRRRSKRLLGGVDVAQFDERLG
jgi:hypothetical protein